MLSLPVPLLGRENFSTKRLCLCWKITFKDANVFRFTDHDQNLDFNEDNDVGLVTQTYLSASWDTTAFSRESNLNIQNTDAQGFINSNYITEADLRAGRYRGAKVERFTVDYRVPWIGYYDRQIFYVDDVTYNGETWVVQLSSLARFLTTKVGRTFTRTCDVFDFGDNRCGFANVNDPPYKVISVRVDDGTQDATHPRRIFEAVPGDVPSPSGGVTITDGWYKFGKVIWTSGQNADIGHISYVKEYTHSNRLIELVLPTPFDIDDADEFTLTVGCDRRKSTCRDKFNNIANHRGFPSMPGSDRVLRTPKLKK